MKSCAGRLRAVAVAKGPSQHEGKSGNEKFETREVPLERTGLGYRPDCSWSNVRAATTAMATCVSWRTQQALTDPYQYDAFDMPIASTGTTSNNYLYSGEQGILLSGTLTAQIERERQRRF